MIKPEFQKIADKIRSDIDSFCQTYDDGHRTHLGASIIGDKCKRKLWFTFRWVYHHKHTGRVNRIFNTGHCEEIRMIEWLKGAGYEVENMDTNTQKQFRIIGVNGHFGGSIDGIVNVPSLGKCLLECKTNKTGSEFKAYFDDGMQLNKPKHWAQVCTYGYKLGIIYCLYICKNKDNDDLYIEIIELDWNHGKEMEDKAGEIIYGMMPARISETPAYFECKYCDYLNICHNKMTIEVNCRSCKNAEPVENGEWKCSLYNAILPSDFIPKGCKNWIGVM